MDIKKLKILRQSSAFGSWWGNMQNVGTHMNIYIQFLVLAFSATAAYGVFSEGASQRGYNIPFWLFALSGVCLLGIAALFVWKFTMHSTFSAWNYQWWEHDNPLRAEVQGLKEQLNRMENELKELKNGSSK